MKLNIFFLLATLFIFGISTAGDADDMVHLVDPRYAFQADLEEARAAVANGNMPPAQLQMYENTVNMMI